MTPKVKIFEIVFPDSATDTEIRSVTKLVKIVRCEVAEMSRGLPKKKTRAPRDSPQPPFWPKWADRAQNFLNVVTS